MARTEFSLEPRQVTGKKVAQLRRAGVLPASIYGRGLASIAVQANLAAFATTMRQIGANEVIDLKVAGERVTRPAVVYKVQRHPLTGQYLHADFYQVSLTTTMRADVPVVLTGRSEAVETLKGVLLQGINTIHVEALPLDLPAHVEVDVSVLEELEASIHVSDLHLPANVTVLTDPGVLVARVASPRVGEEGAAAEAEAAEEGAAAGATEAGAEPAGTSE
jgi:large subunit ribosomal protein L25